MLENQTPQSIPMCAEGSILYWQGKKVEMRRQFPFKFNTTVKCCRKSNTRVIVHVTNSTHLTSATLGPWATVSKLSGFQCECPELFHPVD